MKSIEIKAHEIIENKLAKRESVIMQWLVQEIIITWKHQPKGAECVWCAGQQVWKVAKEAVRKYDDPEDTTSPGSQMTLPGYERLQQAYSVPRNGEVELVDVRDMYSEERRARSAKFRTNSAGLLKHALELDQFDDNNPNPMPGGVAV